MIESSFCDLRSKSVINVLDGKNLGNICDIVLEICSGKILGFVVPLSKGILSIFKGSEDLFIPYRNVCKIGQDVILVELSYTETKNFKTSTFSEVLSKNKGKQEDEQAVVPLAFSEKKNGGEQNDK